MSSSLLAQITHNPFFHYHFPHDSPNNDPSPLLLSDFTPSLVRRPLFSSADIIPDVPLVPWAPPAWAPGGPAPPHDGWKTGVAICLASNVLSNVGMLLQKFSHQKVKEQELKRAALVEAIQDARRRGVMPSLYTGGRRGEQRVERDGELLGEQEGTSGLRETTVVGGVVGADPGKGGKSLGKGQQHVGGGGGVAVPSRDGTSTTILENGAPPAPAPATQGRGGGITASLEQELANFPRTPSTWKRPFWVLGFLLFLGGSLGNAVAFGFAPQSILGTLSPFSLLANLVLAPLILKEQVGFFGFFVLEGIVW